MRCQLIIPTHGIHHIHPCVCVHLQRKRWQLYAHPALFGGLVGADADGGPVGGGLGVGPWVAVFDEGAEKFVNHMRMAAAVAAALDEG